MTSALLFPFWRNKERLLSKVLISEVKHTRYNTTYSTQEKSKEEIARLAADAVMEEYESVIIERFVKANYSFLDPGETDGIIAEAKIIAADDSGCDFPSYNNRKEILYEKILEYLEDNKTIVPCGFVDFRFRQMYFWAERIAARGADIYFDKREYEEFTYLLSLFVSTRECKEEVIHIIWEDGDPHLYNKRGRDVTKKYEKDFLQSPKRDELTEDDLAISAVIAASPERLVLHSPPDGPLSGALCKIYLDRCKICPGCNICKKY